MDGLGFLLIIVVAWAWTSPQSVGKWSAQVAKAYKDARK